LYRHFSHAVTVDGDCLLFTAIIIEENQTNGVRVGNDVAGHAIPNLKTKVLMYHAQGGFEPL